MEHFQIDQRRYIAVVRREDVETTPDDPIQLAVYAPGTVCLHWLEHKEKAVSLSYGYLFWAPYHSWSRGCWGLVGSGCLECRLDEANPQPWRTALDQRHYLAGTGLDVAWRAQTRRRYWRLVPLMGMILQVEPRYGILRGYLGRATRDKRPFTDREKKTLLAILRERGGTERAVGKDWETWDRELKSHHEKIKRRRDSAFRLACLAALKLRSGDRTRVESFRAYNTTWRDGRMLVLTDKQVGKVRSWEARCLEQRAEASEALAQALAREFGIERLRG